MEDPRRKVRELFRLIVFTLCAVLGVALLEACEFMPGCNIPCGPAAHTQKDFEKLKYSWLVRQTEDAYGKIGEIDPECGPEGKRFLANACRMETNQDLPLPLEQLEGDGRVLLEARCKDPLIVLWYGKVLYRMDRFEEAQSPLLKSLEALQQSEYSQVHGYFAAHALSEILLKRESTPDDGAKQLRIKALQSLGAAISSGDFLDSEAPVAFRLAFGKYAKEFGIPESRIVYEAMAHTRGIDPWLLKTLEGDMEIHLAWEARGDKPAKQVTPQGWAGLHEHLDRARRSLMDAWTLHPEYPEAALLMMKVALGGRANQGETPRLWFNRSVAAQFDYHSAYSTLLNALKPQWGGSIEAMEDFGLECLATKRFDTDVPIFYLTVLRETALEYFPVNWRKVFQRPEVHRNLTRLFDGMLKEPSRAGDRDRILTQQAVTEAWCGLHEKAKQTLASTRSKVDFQKGFWWKAISWSGMPRDLVEAEIRAFTGPQAKLLQEAESYSNDGLDKTAEAAFEEAMKASSGDEGVRSYLRYRIANLRMGEAAARATARYSLLFVALEKKHSAVAEYLIENGEDVNATNHLGESPLHLAVYYRDKKLVKMLLEQGSNVDTKDNSQRTPLYHASLLGEPEIAQMVIDKGADVNGVSHGGWTPLHLAAYYGHDLLTDLLLRKGANPNAQLISGETPLQLAQNLKHTKVVGILKR